MSRISTKPFGLSSSPLASAWFLGPTGADLNVGSASRAPSSAAPPDQGSHGCTGAALALPTTHNDIVLVSRGSQAPPDLFHGRLLGSRREIDHVYRIETIVLDKLAEIEGLCRARVPRVLLVDARLVLDAGACAVRHLHREFPAVDWLLGWDAPPAGDFDVALLSQMRGGICWAADAEGLVRALDAVTAGKLWFPRALLESLYLALLDADAPHAPEAPARDLCPALTARELEVRALMRHGMTNRQIALQLGVSVNTVKKHLAHVFEKRGLHCRRQDFL